MLKNILATFLVRGFGALAVFFMTFATARISDTSSAGIFFLGLSVTIFFGSLVTYGAPIFMLKQVAERQDDWSYINGKISGFLILGLLVSSVLIFVTFPFSEIIQRSLAVKSFSYSLFLLGISIFCYSANELLSHCFQGIGQSVKASIIHNLLPPALFILLAISLSIWNVALTSVMLIALYSLSLLMTLCFACFSWLQIKNAEFRIEFLKVEQYETFAKLTSLWLVILMAQLVQWIGQFAVATFGTSEEIALYSVALRTSMLVSFILLTVNVVLAPKYASAFSCGKLSEVDMLALYSSRLMLLMSTPVLLTMLIIPELILSLFGEEYLAAASYLQILACGQFINVVTGSVGYLLNMTGHEHDFRNVVLVSGLISIPLAFFFTSIWGGIGTAYATAFCVASQNLLAAYMVKKRLGFNTLNLHRTIT